MHPIQQIRTHNGASEQQQPHDQSGAPNRGLQSKKSNQQRQEQSNNTTTTTTTNNNNNNNMTVLQRLDPLLTPSQQPVLSSLDPVQQQQQLQNIMPPLTPQLHQMQPSRQLQMGDQHDNEHQQLDQQQHQQQQLHHPHPHHHQHHHHQLQQQQQQQHQQQHLLHDQEQADAGRRSHSAARSAHLERYITDGAGQIAKWLVENYETADGDSLPRSTVYNHYMAHCKQMNMAAVNAASFGKIIRSVFVSLKTRRLGTRGHSKYHYFGVRAKSHVRLSEWLNQSTGDGQQQGASAGSSSGLLRDANDNSNGTENASESDSTGEGRRSCPLVSSGANHKRLRRANESEQLYATAHYHRPDQHHEALAAGHAYSQHVQQEQQQQQVELHHHQAAEATTDELYYSRVTVNGYDKQQGAPFAIQPHSLDREPQYEQYDLSAFRNDLGSNRATLVTDHWPQREPNLFQRIETKPSRHLNQGLVDTFENQYKSYYTQMVEFLGELQFAEIEHLMMDFWHPAPVPVAHETIHWTSTNTGEPGATCEALSADSNGRHHQTDYQHQDQGAHHLMIQQQQQPPPPPPQQQQLDSQQMTYQVNSLTLEQLYQITSHPAMIERIDQIDGALYSAIESFLITDMLNPMVRPLLHHLRMFARNICSWTETAVREYPTEFAHRRLSSAKAFGLALKRAYSINYLASASRSIWNQRANLNQIRGDLCRLDLHDIDLQVSSIIRGEQKSPGMVHPNEPDIEHHHLQQLQEQQQQQHQQQQQQQQQQRHPMWTRRKGQDPDQLIDNNKTSQPTYPNNPDDNHDRNYNNSNHDNLESSPVTGCLTTEFRGPLQPGRLVQNLLNLLGDPYPSNAWSSWCKSLVESNVKGRSSEEAKEFILRWNYYISLISRELALRSAPSLGSFQLVRLLFDEYMYHLVVKRLARVQQGVHASEY